MSSIHDTLERESERYTIHHGAFDRMTRRRDRKRRNERIAALVVGIAIVIGIVVVGSVILRSAHEPTPVDRTHHPLLREGEVLELGGDGATLVATDIATGTERTLACSDCPQLGDWGLSAEGGWIAYAPYGPSGCRGTCPPGHGLWVVGANRDPILATIEPWGWAWSPSAELLAFVDRREGRYELVLLDPATGERTTIVTSPSWIGALAWSPDGTQLAATARSGIQVVVLETRRSTSIAPAARGVDHMSWSPDGTRLVFEEVAIDGRDQIGVVNVDGSDDRILVDHGVQQDQVQPTWSPDGTRIAYVTWSDSGGGSGVMSDPRRPGELSEVWTIGADGSDATRLFHARCCVAQPYAVLSARMTPGPVWSPDGSRIAFVDLTHDDWMAYPGFYRAVASDGTGSAEWIDQVVAESWAQGQ